VRRNSLVEEVVSRIRELIRRNSLGPGDRLPSEAELTGQFAVSRSVLREAVRQLGAVGLVTVKHGHGMFVGDADALAGSLELVRSAMALVPRDLTQFAELRTAMECHVARRAAELATPAQAAALRNLCEQMDQTDLLYEESIGLDFAFHRKLIEIVGNQLMLGVMTVLQQFIIEGMLQTTPKPRDHSVSQKLHYAIVEAVAANDPDRAVEAMREHMRITNERLALAAARKQGRV